VSDFDKSLYGLTSSILTSVLTRLRQAMNSLEILAEMRFALPELR
jgi:hypothetical protein